MSLQTNNDEVLFIRHDFDHPPADIQAAESHNNPSMMTFSTGRQGNLEPVEVTEMSWINDMTRLERQSISRISYQKTYPYSELNSLVTHKATPAEQHETARPPQSVHVTSIPKSPTRGTTTIASASTRHDPNHREIQSWHESPTRGDRLEEWFSETSHIAQRQGNMRSEARRFVDIDADTRRALRALEELVGQSGSDRRGGSWQKQQPERELQWIGGWVKEGYTPR